MADLGAQLAQLSPEQRQAIMIQAQNEANQAVLQEMMKDMVSSCFQTCATTSVSFSTTTSWQLYLHSYWNSSLLPNYWRLYSHIIFLLCFCILYHITTALGRQVGQSRTGLPGCLSRSVPANTTASAGSVATPTGWLVCCCCCL